MTNALVGVAAAALGCGERSAGPQVLLSPNGMDDAGDVPRVDAAAPSDAAPGPTPPCVETVDDPEGPFYKAGAPERASLVEQGMPGVRLTLRGHVVVAGEACAPLAGAVLDLWQADAAGGYDNDGFRLRGRVRCDAEGRYEVRTIVPGRYLNGADYRPMHIHVVVTAPGYPPLTTQLYFEGDPFNAKDDLFKPELVMRMVDDGDGKSAAFVFALAA